METTRYHLRPICKQEVTGSIPVGSIEEVPANGPIFARNGGLHEGCSASKCGTAAQPLPNGCPEQASEPRHLARSKASGAWCRRGSASAASRAKRSSREPSGRVLQVVPSDTIERAGWDDRLATEALVPAQRSRANATWLAGRRPSALASVGNLSCWQRKECGMTVSAPP
jgi:hypothetical protein